MTETSFKDKVIRRLKRLHGCKVIKIQGNQYQEVGTPDILASYKGRLIVIELKVGDNTMTAIQKQRAAEWEAAGALFFELRG